MPWEEMELVVCQWIEIYPGSTDETEFLVDPVQGNVEIRIGDGHEEPMTHPFITKKRVNVHGLGGAHVAKVRYRHLI